MIRIIPTAGSRSNSSTLPKTNWVIPPPEWAMESSVGVWRIHRMNMRANNLGKFIGWFCVSCEYW